MASQEFFRKKMGKSVKCCGSVDDVDMDFL